MTGLQIIGTIICILLAIIMAYCSSMLFYMFLVNHERNNRTNKNKNNENSPNPPRKFKNSIENKKPYK
jgi:flagellar basal body-associated protein FliL